MTHAPFMSSAASERTSAQARPGGVLVLEDGTAFEGVSVGAAGTAVGEAVFTTSMTGYQEAITDPSFHGQLVCFTAPMVGNYGVSEEWTQSPRARAAGTVMRSCTSSEWETWLRDEGIVALAEVDTRRLTTHLRERGTMRAIIVADVDAGERPEYHELASDLAALPAMRWPEVIADVSTPRAVQHSHGGSIDVGVVDLGCKRSLLDLLSRGGCSVTLHPHDVDAITLGAHDAIVLSSGPGDPALLDGYLPMIRSLVGEVPMVGVCLGHQLLARALGHDTHRLPFGHRGANHPVLDRRAGRVLVTSQNHGYAVALHSAEDIVTHVSLYDGTVEGFVDRDQRVAGIQFHPEAAPGPNDAHELPCSWIRELVGAP